MNLPLDFETAAEADREDAIRLARFTATVRNAGLRSRPELRLVTGIKNALQPDTPPTTWGSLASFRAGRARREAILPLLVQAFASYVDEPLATATVVKSTWSFDTATLLGTSAARLKSRFRFDLNEAGVFGVPGPLLAMLDAEFDPRIDRFMLHWHIVTTDLKARALHRLKDNRSYGPTPTGAAPVQIKPLRDPSRQLSYLLKSYWCARPTFEAGGKIKRVRGRRRIPEPFGSRLLMWLHRQSYADLLVMSGMWSRRLGGQPDMRNLVLAIEACSPRQSAQLQN